MEPGAQRTLDVPGEAPRALEPIAHGAHHAAMGCDGTLTRAELYSLMQIRRAEAGDEDARARIRQSAILALAVPPMSMAAEYEPGQP